MNIDNAMIDRAANAIKECMANNAWKIHGVTPERANRYVRQAAEMALRWAIQPEQAFESGENVSTGRYGERG